MGAGTGGTLAGITKYLKARTQSHAHAHGGFGDTTDSTLVMNVGKESGGGELSGGPARERPVPPRHQGRHVPPVRPYIHFICVYNLI
jgi:cysteine synthase